MTWRRCTIQSSRSPRRRRAVRAFLVPLTILAALSLVACDDDDPVFVPGNPQQPNTGPTIVVTLTPVAAADGTAFAAIEQDGLSLGDADAPVTVEFYTNFICGSCATFARETLPALVTDYVAPGDVRFVFRHAPLGGAPAIRAHEAAQCAAGQDRFWQAFVQIYANFSQESAAYSEDRLAAMMANAGVDAAAYDACIEGSDHRAEIEASVAAFSEVQAKPGAGFAAATATVQQRPLLPVVFINDTPIVAPTLDEMRELIEEELP